MVSAGGGYRRSRATCECIGGGWVRMVVAGEVNKDKAAAGGIVIFLGWAMMCLWAPRSGG
jgi:hypothetical protein